MKTSPTAYVNTKNVFFFLLVIAITAYRLIILHRNEWNLIFDEAQYWLWSLHPDWGYYSKPPLIAWLINLTTSFCGNGEACIRLAAPVAHALTSIGVYLTAFALFKPEWRDYEDRFYNTPKAQNIAFWSGLVYLTLPAVSFSSMLISTDPFLLACWSWSMFFIVRAIGENRTIFWLMAGITTGFGLLAKYAMILIFPCLIIALMLLPELRQYYKSKGYWLYLCVSLLILSPNLIWNLQNDLVTFSHTKDNANIGTSLFHPDKMLEFIGSQLAVFGPILFISFIWLILRITRSVEDRRYRFLIAFSLPYIVFFIIISLLSRAHANWASPTYVGASILATAWLLQSRVKQTLLGLSFVIHLLIGGIISNYTSAMALLDIKIQKSNDPFYRQRGMKTLGEEVAKKLESMPGAALISDSRTIIAPLLYYVRPFPASWVKMNEDTVISDYYEMHSDFKSLTNKSFLFVSDHPPSALLKKEFDKVVELEPIRIEIYPETYNQYSIVLLKKETTQQ